MDTGTAPARGPALQGVVGVAVVGAVGCLLMAVAHAGVEVPLVSGLGPGGDAVVPQAAAGFAVGAVMYAITAGGLARRRPWAWALGLVVSALVLVGSALPFRGAGSAAGISLGAIGLVLLVLPSVRSELLPAR